MDHKDLIRAAECCDLKDCEVCPSKGRVCCRERTMQELAAALKNEILRAKAAEARAEKAEACIAEIAEALKFGRESAAISIQGVLKAVMLDGIYEPEDCRLISPEEFDREYGEVQDNAQ